MRIHCTAPNVVGGSLAKWGSIQISELPSPRYHVEFGLLTPHNACVHTFSNLCTVAASLIRQTTPVACIPSVYRSSAAVAAPHHPAVLDSLSTQKHDTRFSHLNIHTQLQYRRSDPNWQHLPAPTKNVKLGQKEFCRVCSKRIPRLLHLPVCLFRFAKPLFYNVYDTLLT